MYFPINRSFYYIFCRKTFWFVEKTEDFDNNEEVSHFCIIQRFKTVKFFLFNTVKVNSPNLSEICSEKVIFFPNIIISQVIRFWKDKLIKIKNINEML
jgi:hypothetical protein